MQRLFQKLMFRIRPFTWLACEWRKAFLRVRGAKFGRRVSFERSFVNWPHQLNIGDDAIIEHGVVFKFSSYWMPGPRIVLGRAVFVGTGAEFNITERISIGEGCLLAAGSRYIDHDHGIALDRPMRSQPGPASEIRIDDDVWIGANVVVLKGVTIGRGAIVGAGAIVTHSIPAFEIWAGVPAKKIGDRRGMDYLSSS